MVMAVYAGARESCCSVAPFRPGQAPCLLDPDPEKKRTLLLASSHEWAPLRLPLSPSPMFQAADVQPVSRASDPVFLVSLENYPALPGVSSRCQLLRSSQL